MSNNMKAQKLFTNVNSELCIELYRLTDELGVYRVYMVYEDLTKNDSIMLKKWHTLKIDEMTYVVQHWAYLGRRIETDREPFMEKYSIEQPFLPGRRML